MTAAGCAQVICLDNFFTGSKDNIKHLIGKPNFELMRCAPPQAALCHNACLNLTITLNTSQRSILQMVLGARGCSMFISSLPRSSDTPLSTNFTTCSQPHLLHLSAPCASCIREDAKYCASCERVQRKTPEMRRRHDVVERLVLEVDQIYHLACPASPVHYKCAWSLAVCIALTTGY